MKRTKFMKTNILFGILLLTLCLFTGSCSNDDKAVIEPLRNLNCNRNQRNRTSVYRTRSNLQIRIYGKKHQVYRYQYAARRMDCGGKGKRKQHQYKSYF